MHPRLERQKLGRAAKVEEKEGVYELTAQLTKKKLHATGLFTGQDHIGTDGAAAINGNIQTLRAEPQRRRAIQKGGFMVYQETAPDILKRLVEYITLQRPGVLASLKDVDAVGKTECVDHLVGQLIEVGGFEYLNKLLSLQTDDEFRFVLDLPAGDVSMGFAERQALLQTVRQHHENCAHCRALTAREADFSEQFTKICDDWRNRRTERTRVRPVQLEL
jgi:hypothetical protein